jgi:hypothetical protein
MSRLGLRGLSRFSLASNWANQRDKKSVSFARVIQRCFGPNIEVDRNP